MTLDRFLNKKYDKDFYNCMHFVNDVWQAITGKNINNISLEFLLNSQKRYVPPLFKKSFKKIKQPITPCICLMARQNFNKHVGVFINNKILHITEKGVEFLPLDIATRGFRMVRFYIC
jgi:hypothetical protein